MSDSRNKINFDTTVNRPTHVTRDIIRVVCDRILENIHPKKIVLFGSQAMGKAKKNSDLDLLVIIERHNPLAKLKRRDRYVEVLRLFQHKGFGLDAIVLTEDEIQKIINDNEGEWDLILDILNQGKTIYEQKAETK